MTNLHSELRELDKLKELHKDNPALQDAYDQIKTIRALMGFKEQTVTENVPKWQSSYFKVLNEIDFDNDNPQVAEAWEKYYMLKKLVGK